MTICDDCITKPSCEQRFFIRTPMKCGHYIWDKKCRKTSEYCEVWGEYYDYPEGCPHLKGEDDCTLEEAKT